MELPADRAIVADMIHSASALAHQGLVGFNMGFADGSARWIRNQNVWDEFVVNGLLAGNDWAAFNTVVETLEATE